MRINREGCRARVDFRTSDPTLDLIALRIIWKKDRRLWLDFAKRFPIFTTLSVWEDEACQSLIRKVYDDRRQEFLQARQFFNGWWSEIEDRWFSFLLEVFESDSANNNMTFFADIGIAPISPRDLDKERFLIPFYVSKSGVKRICAHETSHFFFYRKVKEINFTVQPDERHLWLISEIFVPLLFSDHRSVSILGQMPQDSYICKQSLIERCQRIYQEELERETGVKNLLKRLLQVKIVAEELNQEFFD